MLEKLINLVNQYGPTLGVLIVAWYRDQLLAEKHAKAVAELERKMLQNKADIDAKFGDKSSAAIIIGEAGPGSGP